MNMHLVKLVQRANCLLMRLACPDDTLSVHAQTIAERERLEKEEEELQKRNDQRLAARKVGGHHFVISSPFVPDELGWAGARQMSAHQTWLW